jgi:hypothetical protein
MHCTADSSSPSSATTTSCVEPGTPLMRSSQAKLAAVSSASKPSTANSASNSSVPLVARRRSNAS